MMLQAMPGSQEEYCHTEYNAISWPANEILR
jgi:hypothetical protein